MGNRAVKTLYFLDDKSRLLQLVGQNLNPYKTFVVFGHGLQRFARPPLGWDRIY